MSDDKDYGVCEYCGAKKVLNPRTGKIFCSEKCWLEQTPPVASPTPAQSHYQGQVVQTPHNATPYQTMSDFEVKAIAELKRLSDGYEKLFNAIKTIELALPEEIRTAMQIHESDNQLEQLQNVGLAPNSDIPVVEDMTEDIPF